MNLRLLGQVASMSARGLMSYRADFWISTIAGFFVQLGVIWFLWKAIFAEAGATEIGGMTFRSMIVYYFLVILLGKLVRGNDNDMVVSTEIYSGTLTRYLIYPVRYFRMVYAQRLGLLSPGLLQLILFSTVLPLALRGSVDVQISVVSVLQSLSLVALATTLHFLIYLPVESVAFWADNVWSLNVMMRMMVGLFGGALLPLSVFPELFQAVLEYTPFPYLFYLPVRAFMGHLSGAEWLRAVLVSLLWIVIMHGVAGAVWRRGERQYTGVGI